MNGTLYLTLKTVHIVGIISWMAGLLYLFRLFIYHFNYARKSEEIHQLLSLMEKRLFRYITVPAMVVAVGAAIGILILTPDLLNQRWFQLKLFAGILMIGVTLHGSGFLRRFREKDLSSYTDKKLRIWNEVPTLLMIVIVALVIFRPF